MTRDKVSTLLLFGATGDLAHRMLLPSLYGLHADGLLPDDFRIVCTARSDLTDDQYQATAVEALKEHGSNAVVIAGGLGYRLKDRFATSGFADRFIAKGRFERRMENIPVKLVNHPQPGLFGAAAAFAKEFA